MIPNPRSNFNNSCFPNDRQQQQMYGTTHEGVVHVITNPSMDPTNSESNDHYNSLLYNLSILKEKFHQAQSLVMTMPRPQSEDSTCASLASLTTFIQELVVAASSMIFTCQQMAINTQFQNHQQVQAQATTRLQDGLYRDSGPASGSMDDWYEEEYNMSCPKQVQFQEPCKKNVAGNGYDIVELNAADLLAKYTHYCQVCGKGFKRDANLRMHMRAHGDEYKSAAALSNPMKTSQNNDSDRSTQARKYSCPQEGCRWNRKHDKFQPLKSMICAKNHYKRSHCPKMYVCKRCARKQFSVLSDLRTHEKHCGDLKWLCSCGTTFSRKDKLMGHVGLFVGHMPVTSNSTVADRKRVNRGASSSFIN